MKKKDYFFEKLGYNAQEVLEIIGFGACFRVHTGRSLGDQTITELYKAFNGDWEEAAKSYLSIKDLYKFIGRSLGEREILDEIWDEFKYYR